MWANAAKMAYEAYAANSVSRVGESGKHELELLRPNQTDRPVVPGPENERGASTPEATEGLSEKDEVALRIARDPSAFFRLLAAKHPLVTAMAEPMPVFDFDTVGVDGSPLEPCHRGWDVRGIAGRFKKFLGRSQRRPGDLLPQMTRADPRWCARSRSRAPRRRNVRDKACCSTFLVGRLPAAARRGGFSQIDSRGRPGHV